MFRGDAYGAGRGRGRASVLPAWMTNPDLAKGSPPRTAAKQRSRFDQRPADVSRKRSRSSSLMETSCSNSPKAKDSNRRRSRSPRGNHRSAERSRSSRRRKRSTSSQFRRRQRSHSASRSCSRRQFSSDRRSSLYHRQERSPPRRERKSPPPPLSHKKSSSERRNQAHRSPYRRSERRRSRSSSSKSHVSKDRVKRSSPRRPIERRRRSSTPRSRSRGHHVSSERYRGAPRSPLVETRSRSRRRSTSSDRRRTTSRRGAPSRRPSSRESPKRFRGGYVDRSPSRRHERPLSPKGDRAVGPRRDDHTSKRSLPPNRKRRESRGSRSRSQSKKRCLSSTADHCGSLCQRLTDIRNMGSKSEKRTLLRKFMDSYMDENVFAYETPDGARHSLEAFEKMIMQSGGSDITVTRRVLIDSKDATYCFEAEWSDDSKGSFTLYVWTKAPQLTRYYKFDDPSGVASPERRVDFQRLRDTKTWCIVHRYLRKKDVLPTTECHFVDCVRDSMEHSFLGQSPGFKAA